MKGKCIIVGAGEFAERRLPVGDGDFLIAADAGFAAMQALRIVPDLVVGDFDSLQQIPEHPNRIVLPGEKDDTDMAAAVYEGIKRGFREFLIYGGLGGRLDHSIANIQLLAHLTQNNRKVTLVGTKEMVYMLKGPARRSFSETEKGTISVFAYSDVCRGVCEHGLKYGLEDKYLTNEDAIGVSNEFTGAKAEVSLQEGLLLFIQERMQEQI